MSARDVETARPYERTVGDGTRRDGPGNALDRLDDAQVPDLVSNAYWTLLERFFSPDKEGTNVPSAARVR
jgi:hypothetical protein